MLPDLRAIRAPIELPRDNGPTKGHINRLKTLKRQMYGRAGFGLLRARSLTPPRWWLETEDRFFTRSAAEPIYIRRYQWQQTDVVRFQVVPRHGGFDQRNEPTNKYTRDQPL